MLRKVAGLLVALFSALVSLADAGWAQGRHALVIANSAYRHIDALPNPVKDAVVVEAFLKASGFEVTVARDLERRALVEAVETFARSLEGTSRDSSALIYFAGHGVQVDGHNYLLPVDARITREADIALQGVRLDDVMRKLDGLPSATRIVVLDACRNNPFEAASVARGLAIVSAPPGTLVAYSTSPGATAEDGRGEHSPFVLAFLKAAGKPGAPIETALKDTRVAVHAATAGRQIPWEVSSLVKPFTFVSGKAEPSRSGTEAAKDEAGWRRELEGRSAREAVEIVVREDTVVVYQVFLALFPDAPEAVRFRTILERRIEMWAWYEAVTLDTVAAYEAFLARYATSDLAVAARRLAERARQRTAFLGGAPRSLLASAPAGAAQTLAAGGVGPAAPAVRTVVREVPVVREVIKEVRVPSPPEIRTVVKEVPVVKTVVKEVPGPTRVVEKIVRVPSPPKVVTRVETKVVRVPVPCHCRGGAGSGRGGASGGGVIRGRSVR
jgi:hypothetical protein